MLRMMSAMPSGEDGWEKFKLCSVLGSHPSAHTRQRKRDSGKGSRT